MKKKTWQFAVSSNRKPLTPNQENYWKTILSKILKVGTELEYNLPGCKGSCTEINRLCPCKNNNTEVCESTTCMHLEHCRPEAGCTLCTQYSICKKPEYKTKTRCDTFKFICEQVGPSGYYTCIDSKSFCSECSHFAPEGCQNCVFKQANKSPADVRSELEKTLEPSNFVGVVGRTGVLAVTTDGSLKEDGGVEIPTVGRRPHFPTLYKMHKDIITECIKHGAFLNERCSIHVHVLAGYYDSNPVDAQSKPGRACSLTVSELEEQMPEIILANTHQLIRKYQNSLIWLSMSLNLPKFPNSLTRWGKFRYPLDEYSAIQQKMCNIADTLRAKHRKVHGDGTNTFFNYSPCKFNKATGNIETFHIEGRFMDGSMSPAAITAFAILHYALVIKAVEISRMGILEIGDKNEIATANEITNTLMNNISGAWDSERVSDNSDLNVYIPYIKGQTTELLYLLKNILEEFPPVYDILAKLAEEPVAYRLKRHNKQPTKEIWEAIDSELMSGHPTNEQLSEVKLSIADIIRLNLVMECQNTQEWVENITSILTEQEVVPKNNTGLVVSAVGELENEGKIYWSKTIGAYINKR